MNDRNKFMKAFDNLKKKYDNESKENRKEKIINEIKKDAKNDCGCKR